MFDSLNQKIIVVLQDDFPLVGEPYRELADRIGISEEELLDRLEQLRQSGVLRRMGAVLRHRKVGFTANALCAWQVPLENLETVATAMTACAAVTHCYSRPPQPDWPYNLYIMVHDRSRRGCRRLAAELARQAGAPDYVVLFSKREWKKTSMRYFTAGETGD